jgi:hypothetical protein
MEEHELGRAAIRCKLSALSSLFSMNRRSADYRVFGNPLEHRLSQSRRSAGEHITFNGDYVCLAPK